MTLKLAAIAAVTPAFAQDDNALSIDGAAMVTETAAPAHLENLDTIYSGWRFRTVETQALEMDDFDNPAFVFVEQAETAGVSLKNAFNINLYVAHGHRKIFPGGGGGGKKIIYFSMGGGCAQHI